jgi:hypothetical protein
MTDRRRAELNSTVKTRDCPGELERRILAEFPAPPNTQKPLQRWPDRQRPPEAQEL